MGYWRGKKVCVTGGAGFIGSHLVELLVEDEADVTVADANQSGLWRLEGLRDRVRIAAADVSTSSGADTATSGQQVVFHLAGKVAGIEYNRHNHAVMFSSNMEVATRTMMAAARNGVERLLVVSSACVYPADAAVPTPEHEGSRGLPEPPNEGYGWAKRMAEKLAGYLQDETAMKLAVCRPFNIYGPRDNWGKASAHVIPALIKRVLEGEDPVRVWGSGRQSRAFLHVRDAAVGMKLIAEKAPSAEPINLGNAEEVTVRRLAEMILEAAGSTATLEFDTSKPDGYPRRAADISRLVQVTGWAPRISLQEGLAEMIEDYSRSVR